MPLHATVSALQKTVGNDHVIDRSYQGELIGKTRLALRRVRRVLIQLPTGGGKTWVASNIVKSANEKKNSAVFLCHRDFLLEQTSKTFTDAGIDHSYVAPKRWLNPYSPAHVAMVQTLRNRLHKIDEPDIAIWDEAHHIGATTWAKIMDAWPNARHIGLSATPCRLDGKGLDKWFDEMVIGPSTHELMEIGALNKYRAFAPTSPDLTGLHTRAGDYKKDELNSVMDRSVLIGDMVQHYKRLAMHHRAVYFCTSIEHSKHVAASFNANGIPAMHLDGDHTTFERRCAALAFADRELMVLTNVDLFGEGYDLAAQAGRDVRIEAVGLGRPTQSLGLFMQQVGRALRPGDQPAVILDHAGNIEKHGLPDDDRDWSLRGIQKKPGNASTVRQCLQCFAMIPIAPGPCPHCGAAAATESMGGRQIEEIEGDLEEIDQQKRRMGKKIEEWEARNLNDLIALGRRRGYKEPEKWAAHMWTARERKAKSRFDGQMDFYQQQGMV